MCEASTRDDIDFFFPVIRHELGHTLGLEHIEDDSSAVMSSNSSPQRFFRPADRREFRRANPDFNCGADCPLNRVLLEGARDFALVDRYAVYRTDLTIFIAPFDLERGIDTSAAIALVASSSISSVRAIETDTGLSVSWSEASGLFRAFVSPEADTPVIQPLLVAGGTRSFLSSAIDHDGLQMLALTDSSTVSNETRVVAVDEDGRIVASVTMPVYGLLLSVDGALLYVAEEGEEAPIEAIRLVREEDALVPSARLSITPPNTSFAWARESTRGALVFSNQHRKSLIHRVTAEGTLSIERSIELDGYLLNPAFDEREDDLMIAGWRETPAPARFELHLASFDPETLERRTEWRRISVPDTTAGETSAIIRSSGQVATIWGEGFGDIFMRKERLD